MVFNRVIPSLLLNGNGLYKTVKFKKPKYIGDPINAVRIFNEKNADELVIFDISASEKGAINLAVVEDIVSEAFMPITYGGGINKLEDIESLFKIGVDKISINSAIHLNPQFIEKAVDIYGSQSIVATIDYKKKIFSGDKVYIKGGTLNTKKDPIDYCKYAEDLGVGEIILQSIDLDGTFNGYDCSLVEKVLDSIAIPLTVLGGAGTYNDIIEILDKNVSGAAAGSLFVFKGTRDSILINYPSDEEIPREKSEKYGI